MPTVRRSKVVDAAPDRVWELLADPHHMTRWWPGVTRMEGVEEDRFTQVHMTKKGRGVRVDFHVLGSEPPDGSEPGRRSWSQEVIGTPFERVLNEAITEVEITPAQGGTKVQIAQIQKLRGYSHFGGFMLRRATTSRIDEALENLARLF
jgi:carbon monoxide dehydrogenase subunit G